jgi:glycosyltransferase involved in cell wall biosynthesis
MNALPPVTVAVCTYNRAPVLPRLVQALRAQTCDLPMRILAVNNNSTDDTAVVLAGLAAAPGTRLDLAHEAAQGIVPARNRAIEESLASEYLLFLDDDELPRPRWVQAAVSALRVGADCVGGRVHVHFGTTKRPGWLGDDLLGFLAEVDHGPEAFWIRDESTPVWTANVGYRGSLFRAGLRFDARYSRVGKGVGGGEDVVMFRRLLEQGARMRYVPDMAVEHFVEDWRLKRRYFLRAHYASGVKYGLHEIRDQARAVGGVPLFLFGKAAKLGLKALGKWLSADAGRIRHTMNFTHACGMIAGCHQRWRATS